MFILFIVNLQCLIILYNAWDLLKRKKKSACRASSSSFRKKQKGLKWLADHQNWLQRFDVDWPPCIEDVDNYCSDRENYIMKSGIMGTLSDEAYKTR